MKISLLHATFHRNSGPLEVYDTWISRAVIPSRVEYIIAGDDSDFNLQTIAESSSLKILIGPSFPDRSTAVRNWNCAAKASTGDLLFVIADDLFPPDAWDTELELICSRLDPLKDSFAIKLSDDPGLDDRLMRNPVVSRKFYSTLGLFDERFRGVYCDNDFTVRAFRKAFIIDGRAIKLDHRHPSLDGTLSRSLSQDKQNTQHAYSEGARILESIWRPADLRDRPALFKPGTLDGKKPLPRLLFVVAARRSQRFLSSTNFLFRRIWIFSRRSWRFLWCGSHAKRRSYRE